MRAPLLLKNPGPLPWFSKGPCSIYFNFYEPHFQGNIWTKALITKIRGSHSKIFFFRLLSRDPGDLMWIPQRPWMNLLSTTRIQSIINKLKTVFFSYSSSIIFFFFLFSLSSFLGGPGPPSITGPSKKVRVDRPVSGPAEAWSLSWNEGPGHYLLGQKRASDNEPLALAQREWLSEGKL